MSEHQASQAEKITMILILDIDCSPGILSSSHSLTTFILNNHIAADYSKRDQVFLMLFFLVVWEVVNIYLVLLELAQDLRLIILRGILKPQNTSVELQLVSSTCRLLTDNYLLFERRQLLLCAGITLTNNWNYVHLTTTTYLVKNKDV